MSIGEAELARIEVAALEGLENVVQDSLTDRSKTIVRLCAEVRRLREILRAKGVKLT